MKKRDQVRIISGNWRSRKVGFAARPGLRPSPDRVRETLFNWLQGRLDGWRTLEPYGGSGVLSLEALSRGARHATLVEKDAQTARRLRAECARFADASRCAVVQGEALAWMAASNTAFDLIFLDPPFAGGELAQALPAAARLLRPAGLVYAESGQPVAAPAGMGIHRQGKAGSIHFALLQKQV